MFIGEFADDRRFRTDSLVFTPTDHYDNIFTWYKDESCWNCDSKETHKSPCKNTAMWQLRLRTSN